MNKFRTLNESIKNSHVAFSGILRRFSKPELNQKITIINSFLRNLCLAKGLDFIDNDNVNFKHLGRDGLHINKDGQHIKNSHVVFSGILRRFSKPELNQKITSINSFLRNLCLAKGLDFIDNDNVNFKHLGRDGLHINKDGQHRLALNFINHIKLY